MNELLAWYGYGDKVIRHADHNNSTGQNPSREETDPTLRSKTRFLCNVTEALDANPPDLGQPISESDRTGIQKRSPSSSASSQRHKDPFTRDVSSHSLDSTHSLVAGRHCRPDSVNSLTSTDSTESNLLASMWKNTRALTISIVVGWREVHVLLDLIHFLLPLSPVWSECWRQKGL